MAKKERPGGPMLRPPPPTSANALPGIAPPVDTLVTGSPALASGVNATETFVTSAAKGEILDLTRIERNQRAQPRARLDMATVATYRLAMAGESREDGSTPTPSWGTFPPVVVFRDPADPSSPCFLADGFHRLEAARLAGLESVRAEVRVGGLREAILFSVSANATHGLPRTNDDKKRAVMTLLRDGEWRQWSAREIARQAAVGHNFAAKLRGSFFSALSSEDSSPSQVRYVRDGVEKQMITGKIGRSRPEVNAGDANTGVTSKGTPASQPRSATMAEEQGLGGAVSPLGGEQDTSSFGTSDDVESVEVDATDVELGADDVPEEGVQSEHRRTSRAPRVSATEVREAYDALGADLDKTDGDDRRWLVDRLRSLTRELRARLRRPAESSTS